MTGRRENQGRDSIRAARGARHWFRDRAVANRIFKFEGEARPIHKNEAEDDGHDKAN